MKREKEEVRNCRLLRPTKSRTRNDNAGVKSKRRHKDAFTELRTEYLINYVL